MPRVGCVHTTRAPRGARASCNPCEPELYPNCNPTNPNRDPLGRRALFKDLKWSYEQTYFPFMTGDGTASATVVNAQIQLKFNLKKMQLDPSGTVIVPHPAPRPFTPPSTADAVADAPEAAAAAARCVVHPVSE
jgi:hypothetical protein